MEQLQLRDYPSTKVEAQRSRLKFYFTAAPCKRGHVALRRVNGGHCVECAAEHQRKWWANRPEGEKSCRWRDWYRGNADHRRAYKKAHPHQRAKAKQWHKTNLEGARASARRYYDGHREQFRAKVRNRAALKQAAEGSHSAADVRALIRSQNGRCVYCCCDLGPKYHVDHIIALSAGGRNDRGNLQILCAPCNLSKGAKHPVEFARSIGMLV